MIIYIVYRVYCHWTHKTGLSTPLKLRRLISKPHHNKPSSASLDKLEYLFHNLGEELRLLPPEGDVTDPPLSRDISSFFPHPPPPCRFTPPLNTRMTWRTSGIRYAPPGAGGQYLHHQAGGCCTRRKRASLGPISRITVGNLCNVQPFC